MRWAFCLAKTASVLLNDLYSKSKESEADFDLLEVIAIEEKCSLRDAIERTVEIHTSRCTLSWRRSRSSVPGLAGVEALSGRHLGLAGRQPRVAQHRPSGTTPPARPDQASPSIRLRAR